MTYRKVIILETRAPQNKDEKGLDGRTYLPSNKDVFTVYLRHNQSPENMFDTIIHELLHVVCNIATFKPKLSIKTEERRIRNATKLVIKELTGQ